MKRATTRRNFLLTAAAAGGAMTLGGRAEAQEPLAGAGTPSGPLPTVKLFGKHDITRMVIGSNPFYGYTHFNNLYDKFVREYYTPERRIEVLKRAERAGMNTWQVHYNTECIEDIHRYRDADGTMQIVLLADFDLMKDWKLLPSVVKDVKPLGIGHHGNRTDERFRNREMTIVHDFINAVHDAGVPAGVSTHNPAVVDYIEERGWDNDYYMTCMYRVSRTREEAREEYRESPLPEIYMEKDPERMCAKVRGTKKTCFAFKIFGAGRTANSPTQVEASFRYVLSNIKPQDPIIVGFCPKFKDEITENVNWVRQVSAELGQVS